MNGFEESKQRVVDQATAEFETSAKSKQITDPKSYRRELNSHIQQAVENWFLTQDPADAICYFESTDRMEIRDAWFGGSITVYRPRPGFEYRDGECRKVIEAGYISGSSWNCGMNGTDCTTMRKKMHNFQIMQRLAIDTLNHYNDVVLDWTWMENPMAQLAILQRELKQLKDAEAERAAKRAARKGGR